MPAALEYALALQRIFIVALSAGCAAAVYTFGMEMKNVEEVQKARCGRRGSRRRNCGSGGDVKIEDPK